MDTIVPPCVVLEAFVVACQVLGVATLCLWRLFPGTRWSVRGRAGFVVALIGLGIGGALCGREDSEFALFAGTTMTALLIGMIMGGGSIDLAGSTRHPGTAEARLAA